MAIMIYACPANAKDNRKVSSTSHTRPLIIQEQGSFAFGGIVITDSMGHLFHGDHAYVFFQKPVAPREYPVVMIHGIHEGPKTWETTPDGREGYQNLLLRRNFSTYNVTMPRRGNAGRGTVGMEVVPAFDEQTWYVKWRIGIYPDYFDNVQFSRSKEAINQFMRQMTPETGPTDFEHNSSTIASLCDSLGGVILMPHSQLLWRVVDIFLSRQMGHVQRLMRRKVLNTSWFHPKCSKRSLIPRCYSSMETTSRPVRQAFMNLMYGLQD